MNEPVDTSEARWPLVLSQAAHEIRTPLGVALGYVRMMLNEQFGPITDKQRRFMTEVLNSAGRIHELTNEMSELAKFDAVRITFEQNAVDIGELVTEVVAALPPVPDREIAVHVDNQAGAAIVRGDRRRLGDAIRAVIYAVRRELVASSRLIVRLRPCTHDGQPAFRLAIAGDHRIDEVDVLPESELAAFNEKRGGCGLQLTLARRIVSAHQGRIWSTREEPLAPLDASHDELLKRSRKAEAVLILPEST
jgi:signal transduction histidine kinase